MSFRRSSSGLKNQPVFFGADVVVYVEGVRAACAIGDETCSVGNADSLFWRCVLDSCASDLRYHFKELGSKTALKEFASSLDGKAVGKVLVCMARDLDDFDASHVTLPCTVRTKCYSWESDIWSLGVLEETVVNLLAVDRLPDDVRRECEVAMTRFSGATRRFTMLDIKLHFTPGVSAFYPRDKPGAIVLASGDAAPECNRAFARSRMRALRRVVKRPWSHALKISIDGWGHIFGKASATFHYHLAAHALRRCGSSSAINHGLLSNLAIRSYGARLARGEIRDRQRYYTDALSAALGMS